MEGDRAALVALYNFTNGDNWNVNTNWKSDDPLDQWQGITTDATGRVTRIGLQSNGLTGRLPDLSALTSLTWLSLNRNQISGRIRAEHFPKSLEFWFLNGNRFSGALPDVSGFTNLLQLNLAENEFSGRIVPEHFPPQLTILVLSDHPHDGELPDFSGLTSLTNLHLANTKLSGTLNSANLPQSVQVLALGNNDFSGAMPDFRDFSALTTLQLNNNRLSGEIDAANLPSTSSMFTLHLADNDFSGAIPDFSSNDIQNIYLSDNRLEGAVNSAFLHTGTEVIYFQNNQLTGELPNLSSLGLVNINLSGNQLEGTIDAANLPTGLVGLSLADNDLSGPLPSINTFTDLTTLDLSNNRLTGQLSDLNPPTNRLNSLLLAGNMLKGEIDLTPYTGLANVDLSNNHFTGDLSKLGDIVTTTVISASPTINVAGNRLTGEIPDLSGMVSVASVILDFSDNQFTGTISADRLPPILNILRLQGNMFTGEIPDFSDLDEEVSKGIVIDLSDNQFTGAILAEKLNPALKELRLSGNMLTGGLPDFSGFGLLEIIDVFPGNDLKGVLASGKLPLYDDDGELLLKELVIGQLVNVVEDAQNPERLCVNNRDDVFKTWDQRADTIFTGGYCGAANIATTRIGRIAPAISGVSISTDDSVMLNVKIFGRQGIQDQALASLADIVWEAEGGSITGTGDRVSYTAPSTAGRYLVTASISVFQCRPEIDCTAEFDIRVLRASPVSASTPEAPQNPTGDIPSILTDDQGKQYEVFTPEGGGSFEESSVALTAGPGAVPNGEVVGLRIDDTGAASNTGATSHRYTLAGTQYQVSGVDTDGNALSAFRLNSAIQVCIPLPDALRANLSDLAMVSRTPDQGSLTVLSTRVSLGADGAVSACSSLNDIPATIAVGSRGAPDAIPTPTPEPEPVLPETGGTTPGSTGSALLLMLIGITLITSGQYILKRTRQRSRRWLN